MTPDLPISAFAFSIRSGKTEAIRKLQDFPTLLHERIEQTLGQPSEALFQSALSTFIEVSEFDAMIYIEALKRLDSLPSTPHEAYYGRDAYWLYIARKAQQFALSPTRRRTVSYAFANSQLLSDPHFDEYLRQHNITENSRHIDVGCNGSTVKAIIRRLAGRSDITPEYQKAHIALLAAHTSDDNPLTDEGQTEMGEDVRRILESRSRHIARPNALFRKNGRLHSNAHFISPEHEILAWSIRQAIERTVLFTYAQPCE